MTDEKPKKKLTLSVDEEVIEKAKGLGINISEMTEGILRSFAFKPDESDREEFYQRYQEIFDGMTPLLKEYLTRVAIGRELVLDVNDQPDHYETYVLNGDGEIWNDDREFKIKGIRSLELWSILSPKEILANFVKALSDAKESRKDQLEELEMAKRLILAMTDSLKGKRKESGK